ncbi:uncharacterized protein LOC115098139 [Rhinatrema bivittatum]|uniref:uncharacterized protein LOC115098139 n=1 Tax=Rhinatrema bivittatum TaxID=194408 RepID=UPI00112B8FA9|nr:uncharacterized protein LOC115098139 [Rhinatrema bivittatum]
MEYRSQSERAGSGRDTAAVPSVFSGYEDEEMPHTSRMESWRSQAEGSLGARTAQTGEPWEKGAGEPILGALRRAGEERVGVRHFQGCAWISGSFLHSSSAEKSAEASIREHLDTDRAGWCLSWFSMGWDELLPFLSERIQMWGELNILIIHLGGNDIGSKSCKELLTCMKKDLSQVMIRWPQILLGWSDMIVLLRNTDEMIWKSGFKKLNRQLGKWMGWRGILDSAALVPGG